jgi:hypothetical protein
MRRAAVLLGCAVLLLPAAPAIGKKKHKKPKGLGPVVTAIATGTPATTPGTFSTADATCPSGLQAVGGGFSAPYSVAGRVLVIESYRSSPSTWQVKGAVLTGSGGSVTAYAYCRRNTVSVTDVVATGATPPGAGGNANVEADCAPGAAAIGGGFQIGHGPAPLDAAFPEWSIGAGPVPGGTPAVGYWHVLAQNNTAASHPITAHAYCATGIKKPAIRQDQVTASLAPLTPFTVGSACPAAPKKKSKKKSKKKPRQLLSGGAFYSPFVPGGTVLPVHIESRIDGKRFIDTVLNDGGNTGSVTAQSQAMCF